MYTEYESIKNLGAVLCEHVAKQGARIHVAKKNEPVCDEDSGWQFSCGCDEKNENEAQIWSLKEVIDLEPSLFPYIQCDGEYSLSKISSSGLWRKEEGK